jgi:hypothetical protein
MMVGHCAPPRSKIACSTNLSWNTSSISVYPLGAKAKMLALKIAPNGAFFREKQAKKVCFLAIIGGFPGFLFTDEYTGAVDQDVYFVPLALITTPQKGGF